MYIQYSPLLPLSLGGAGGKGTWGKIGEVYDDDGHTHDQKDPNYDSEEEVVGYTKQSQPLINTL